MNFRTTILASIISPALFAQQPAGRTQQAAAPFKEPAPLAYVDPYIGTGGHGHVFLGASVPFGAVQVGPTNINKGWDWCSGYHYSDSVVKGFSQNHLNGTGVPDLCDVLVMPYTGAIRTEPGSQDNPTAGYSSHYDHRHEIARPAYYSVWLKDHHVRVELTATERVAFHRYTFPKNRAAHIIVDLFQGNFDAGWQHPKVYAHLLRLDDSTLIGWRNSSQWAQDRRIYFAIRTNFSLKELALLKGDKPINELSLEADSVKGLISFPKSPTTALLKIGVSNTSGEAALANITAEIPAWDFDAIVRQGNQKWQEQLNRIKIEAADSLQRTVFYTSLYHTMVAPALYNDHDSTYRGTDGKVIEHAPYNNYTIFSLWDTYRTLNPLMTLVQPDRVNDIMNTMLAIYTQQGKLPIWHLQGRETNCMVGYSAAPIIADAWLKGFHGFDGNLALEAMKASSTRDDYGVNYLKQEGYIPADRERESVSKALEYAIDDWCIARVAASLGRKDDEARYQTRGELFTRYFDPATKFMRPLLADGKWRTPFSPFKPAMIHDWGDYTEGNGWEYTFLAPQDVEKLIGLMGGDKPFISKLDSLFVVTGSMGEDAPPDISGMVGVYAQGNEPNHHIPYLYAFAGAQWKTAEKIKEITREFYTAKTDGLCGNDDCGQMSAWYVMSALGFYPVNPANGVFVLGTPLVRRAVLQAGEGKPFTMETENFGNHNIYIQHATLNGAPYTKSYIDYKSIKAGSTLRLYMGNKPNPNFGEAPADRPMSQPSGDRAAASPPARPTIYVNETILPPNGPKIAVIGSDSLLTYPPFDVIDEKGNVVFTGYLSKPQTINDWAPGHQFYQADFSSVTKPGHYRLKINPDILSEKFEIGDADWARPMVAAIIHYYHEQRANTPQEMKADSQLRLYGSDRRVDLHGGWCDASGDVSKYFSHLAYANFMSPQQIPLVTWSLINAGEHLRPQLIRWNLTDSLSAEALWGADYLTRSLDPAGYFYMTVFSYFSKDADARRVVGLHANSVTTNEYQCAFREGGGMAIAALARISRWGKTGDYTPRQYLDAARRGYAHLVVNNTRYDDDGKENIIDDYCALMAATELWIATDSNYYRDQARIRAGHLNARMTAAGYFIADDGRRPFWHASDAGLPVVALTRYLDKETDPQFRSPALNTISSALAYNLRVTGGTANPFGYARQSFLYKDSVKDGFFIPHDNETGWWWQGENARLGSLATAALLGSRLLQTPNAAPTPEAAPTPDAAPTPSAAHTAGPAYTADPAQTPNAAQIPNAARTPSAAQTPDATHATGPTQTPGVTAAPNADSLTIFAARQYSWILGCNPYNICFMYQFGANNVPYMHSNYGHGSQRGGISNGITGAKDHGDGSGIDFRNEDHGNEWRWTEQWLPHAAWFLQALTAMNTQ